MKKIHQIWISNKNFPPSEFIKQRINNLKKMYSDCEYTIYNNDSLMFFLKTNFSKNVLLAYTKCKPYAFKADLARYCLLYLYGGYYFDVSICPEFRYYHNDKSFLLKGETVVIDDLQYEVLDNGIMYFEEPSNSFLKFAIEKSVENILSHNYGKHPLDITGPMMLYSLDHTSIKKYQCSFVNNKKVIMINNKKWFEYTNGFSTHSISKYKIDGINEFDKRGTNNYASMWYSKDVFKGVLK